ncbi:MAG: hypothetical protein ACK5ML_11345 [Lachnospiraceae bacterium]
MKDYDIDTQINEKFPPCYIVSCKDDDVIPWSNSQCLKDKLDEYGVPAVFEIGEKGGHGFGEGSGTDVEGWYERALQFYERIV